MEWSLESGLGVIDLGGEWYNLQESRYSLCRPRQGDARQQREMLQNVRATGVDLLGCWYRDSVRIHMCAEKKGLHAPS